MLLLTDTYIANINAEPKVSLFAKVTGAAVLGLIHWFLVISVGKRGTAHLQGHSSAPHYSMALYVSNPQFSQ